MAPQPDLPHFLSSRYHHIETLPLSVQPLSDKAQWRKVPLREERGTNPAASPSPRSAGSLQLEPGTLGSIPRPAPSSWHHCLQPSAHTQTSPRQATGLQYPRNTGEAGTQRPGKDRAGGPQGDLWVRALEGGGRTVLRRRSSRQTPLRLSTASPPKPGEAQSHQALCQAALASC